MKILSIIAILLSLSCTRTVFENDEKNNFKNTANFSKTAIFALAEDMSTYSSWEKSIASALLKKDIEAEAGYKLIVKR